MGGLAVAGGLLALLLAGVTEAGPEVGDGRLAATANGQTICRIDGQRRVIVACDAARPEVFRDLIGPADPAAPAFVALGCLPGDVVATVCRAGDAWSLRTYRTEPGRAVDAGEPLQEIAIGRASGPAATVDLAVSHARGWLVVTGLPAPLPPVLRGILAGVRVGPLSDRSCPRPEAGWRPVAAAVSPLDELVLFLRSDGEAAGSEPEQEILATYDTSGRQLLRLAAGVRRAAGLDYRRSDGTLWTVAEADGGRVGVWRLDAAYDKGRQVVRPSFVSPCERPRDIVCPSSRRVFIAHGEPPASLAAIDAAATSSGAEP